MSNYFFKNYCIQQINFIYVLLRKTLTINFKTNQNKHYSKYTYLNKN